MFVRRILITGGAVALVFATTLVSSHAEENPCDPDAGRYICDGSEAQPEGEGDRGGPGWLAEQMMLPSTGV